MVSSKEIHGNPYSHKNYNAVRQKLVAFRTGFNRYDTKQKKELNLQMQSNFDIEIQSRCSSKLENTSNGSDN